MFIFQIFNDANRHMHLCMGQKTLHRKLNLTIYNVNKIQRAVFGNCMPNR